MICTFPFTQKNSGKQPSDQKPPSTLWSGKEGGGATLCAFVYDNYTQRNYIHNKIL